MPKTLIFKAQMWDVFKRFPKALGLPALLVVALVIWAYSNHFHNDFHFDDSHTISNNMFIRDIKNIPLFFVDARTTSSFPPNQAYRPGLTTLNTIDYWLMHQFFNDALMPRPFFFHLSIFTSYLLLGFFLFLFVFHLLQWSGFDEHLKYCIALFVVGFYWVHMANAETINYIIARSDSFSTLMILIALVIYVYNRETNRRNWFLLPMVIGFSVKEPALMVLPILMVYEFLFQQERTIAFYIKRFGVGIGLAVVVFIISRLLTPPTWISGGMNRWSYLITQPWVILHYFKNFFFPNDLSADTDWKELPGIFDFRFLVGFVFIALLLALFWWAQKKRNTLGIAFGIAWYLIALLPTSSIIPFSEVLNDHRTFFPYIGLTIAFVEALGNFVVLPILAKGNVSLKYLLIGLGFVTLIGHAYATHERNKVWYSELSLWKDVAHKSPENGRGLMNYGLALMGEKNYVVADSCFQRGVQLLPSYSYMYINIAILKSKLNDTTAADLNFNKAIQLGFNTPDPFYFYAQYLCIQRKFDKAIPLLQQALKLSPGHIYSRYVLMNAYADTYRWNELDALVAESVRLFPNDPEVIKYVDIAKNRKSILDREKERVSQHKDPQTLINLSLAQFNAGKYQDCIQTCLQALELDSTNADGYNNLSCAYNQLGDWDNALKYAYLATQHRANFTIAQTNYENLKTRNENVYKYRDEVMKHPTANGFSQLASFYFNGLRYRDCVTMALKAISLDGNSAEAFNTLGAGYSKLGEWDKAMAACKKALAINPHFSMAQANLTFIQQQTQKKIAQ